MKHVQDINIFKAFLVINMIIAHTIQLLSPLGGWADLYSDTINLITYSGFIFAFGYVYQLNYQDKDIPIKKQLRNIYSPIICYYISCFAWMTIIDKQCNITDIMKTLLLLHIYPYSEFILAFGLTSWIYWCIRPWLKPKLLLPAAGILLLIIPCLYWNDSSYYIGFFIGNNHIQLWTVIPYMIFFLIGMHFAYYKTKLTSLIWAIGIIGTSYFYFRYRCLGVAPSRYPPARTWITGSWIYLIAYLWTARQIHSSRMLNNIGENSIVYLLLSNIILFGMRGNMFITTYLAFVIGIIVILTIYYITSKIRYKNI